ncbi:hypothetical protein KIW84_014801 [Lathyrus oleraceus]|uniref:Uncharacterized protein n=1 Tax=Pisum sativum TaxID=3888 RepID=A0A9D5BPD7_PEA|nr:hypothetical protein KIW84_014801 [Pisum sativum]
MALTIREKGNRKVDEGSTSQVPDPLNLGKLVDTPWEKRLLLSFKNHSLTLPKYGNLSTFLSSSFDFPALFHFQGLDVLIADAGPIYHNLVKAFYANLSIGKGCIVSSTIKGKEILLTMEEFGKCLEVPSEGKNMGIYIDKDGIFKHRDVAPSSSLAPPIPKGGYTNVALSNKMCSIETLVTTGFRELCLKIAQLRNQKQEEESEDENMEEYKID